MNTTTNTPLLIAFVIVVVLFLGFGGGAMTGGMMNGGMNGGGWMGERGWMWTPAIVTLGLGVVLGWLIFKKKG
jgi:preprotein translocase subunit SecG